MPVASVPTWLPRTTLPSPSMLIAESIVPPTRLPAPAAEPPIVLLLELVPTEMPPAFVLMTIVPVTSSPTKLPWIWLPVPGTKMPPMKTLPGGRGGAAHDVVGASAGVDRYRPVLGETMQSRDVRADQVAGDERIRDRLGLPQAEGDGFREEAVAGDQVPGGRRRAADPGVGLGARIDAASERRERLGSRRVRADEAALEHEIRVRARGRDRLVRAPVDDEAADRDVIGRGEEAGCGAGVRPVDLDAEDRIEALAGRIRVGRSPRLRVAVDRHGARDRRQRGGGRDRVHARAHDPEGDRVGAGVGVGVGDRLPERPRAGSRPSMSRCRSWLSETEAAARHSATRAEPAKGHGSSCEGLVI